VSRRYILQGGYQVPGVLVWMIMSSAISLSALLMISLVLSVFFGSANINLPDALPFPFSILFVLWGVYAGIGSVVLWFSMLSYWARMERSSMIVRLGWLLAMLFGLQFGAMLYTYWLWRKGVLKVVSGDRGNTGK
jgi:hypothetical protein